MLIHIEIHTLKRKEKRYYGQGSEKMSCQVIEITEENLEKFKHGLMILARQHYQIRRKFEDTEENLAKWCWENIRETYLKRALSSGRYGLLVIVNEKNEVLGFLDYWFLSCFVKGGILFLIQNMRVLPGYRNKGLGTLLVNKLGEIALEKGCKEIQVISSLKARGFYERFGLKSPAFRFAMEVDIKNFKTIKKEIKELKEEEGIQDD